MYKYVCSSKFFYIKFRIIFHNIGEQSSFFVYSLNFDNNPEVNVISVNFSRGQYQFFEVFALDISNARRNMGA